MKQTHNMYNKKLQKNKRKRKAARAKTCFIWKSRRLQHSNFQGHTDKFSEKISESGKTEGPT